MSNVKNITSKILKDAEAGKENILAAAEEEKIKFFQRKQALQMKLHKKFYKRQKLMQNLRKKE